MRRLTVKNLGNSPHDLEGGLRLPAMGAVTAEFSDHYAALLMASPGVETVEAAKARPDTRKQGRPPRGDQHHQ